MRYLTEEILILLLLIVTGSLTCVKSSASSTQSFSVKPSVNDDNSHKTQTNFRRRARHSFVQVSKQPSSETETIRHDEHVNLEPKHSTKFIAECEMPTLIGNYRMRSYTYTSTNNFLEPIVMVSGDVLDKENVIVRIHDQCFTSEVFGSQRCDCKEQLEESLKLIKREGGIVIYLQQEGRGIGIANKVAAYKLQDEGFDTVDANLQLGFKDELREYTCIPDILSDMGIKSIRLVTNNPFKLDQVTRLGVQVNDRIPIIIPPNRFNMRYFRSKKERFQHMIPNISQYDDETSQSQQPSVISTDHVVNLHAGSSDNSFDATNNDEIVDNTVIDEVNHNFRPDIKREYALGKETVLAAIEAIKNGRIVIVVDDENRENEGDLIMAAEMSTPESIGFIVRHSSGVICISLESSRLDELKLPPMVINNEDPKQTAYTVSVDYKHGTSTGISSADRAACFRALVDPTQTYDDFQRPGHVFPLRYREGGVLARAGHTEASLDLCRLAGMRLGGVLAEIVHDDGSLKRYPDLVKMSIEHNLVMTSVQDITAYRIELLEQQNFL